MNYETTLQQQAGFRRKKISRQDIPQKQPTETQAKASQGAIPRKLSIHSWCPMRKGKQQRSPIEHVDEVSILILLKVIIEAIVLFGVWFGLVAGLGLALGF